MAVWQAPLAMLLLLLVVVVLLLVVVVLRAPHALVESGRRAGHGLWTALGCGC